MWHGKWWGRGGGQEAAIKKLTISMPSSEAQGNSSDGSPTAILSNEAIDEFESQMDALYSSCHFNIGRIFGACIDPANALCIVEEFAEHGSLFDVLHNRAVKLDWWLCWRMAKQLAMGLNYLHYLEPVILHGNLRSSNVLVADRWTIKICDIGLSRVREEIAQHLLTNSSNSQSSIGAAPVRWRAPETMRRNPEWSAASDVYSMGMVMWEIATRQIPFQDVSDNYLIPIIVRVDGDRPAIPDDCPSPLTDIIQRCWSAEPEDRPSCEQVLQQMNEFDGQFPEQLDSLPKL